MLGNLLPLRCSICAEFSARCNKAACEAERSTLERGQKQHLLNVHQYRLIQQRLNVLSETAGSNILKVDLDGLDQSKTKFPRNLQSSKTLASCWRPQLHLVGVIAWGVSGINYSCCFGVFLPSHSCWLLVIVNKAYNHVLTQYLVDWTNSWIFWFHTLFLKSLDLQISTGAQVLEGYLVLEPDIAKDSSCEVTIIMKALDWVVDELTKAGKPMPEHLILEVGNCF